MLVVDTYLSLDSFGGIGLFASNDINSGTVIWRWNDAVEKVFSKSEFLLLPSEFQVFLRRYGYSPAEDMIVLNLDNSRFFNHSDTPNTVEDENAVITASKDIKKGEEITCDYKLFNQDKSFCGSFLYSEIHEP